MAYYFYWLVGRFAGDLAAGDCVSVEEESAADTRTFWLDIFLFVWNYFLFALVAYNALSDGGGGDVPRFLALSAFKNLVALHVASLLGWVQLVIIFVVRDFMQWNIHRMYHHVD